MFLVNEIEYQKINNEIKNLNYFLNENKSNINFSMKFSIINIDIIFNNYAIIPS